MMEDKRGSKHSCYPSKEGSPSPSDTKTPPSAPSGSPPRPGSPSEISSHHPCSSVFEQRGPSRKAPVIDLSPSSDEEDLIADISQDFEFTQKLYSELNRVVLGPPGDDKIIILSNSDEEEVREEKTTGTEDAAASAAVKPASTASANTDNAPAGVKNDNSDDQASDQEAGGDNGSGGDASEP
jgi:hypothetical protein